MSSWVRTLRSSSQTAVEKRRKSKFLNLATTTLLFPLPTQTILNEPIKDQQLQNQQLQDQQMQLLDQHILFTNAQLITHHSQTAAQPKNPDVSAHVTEEENKIFNHLKGYWLEMKTQ